MYPSLAKLAPNSKKAKSDGDYDPAEDLARDIVKLADKLHIDDQRDAMLITVTSPTCDRHYHTVLFANMPDVVRNWLEYVLKDKPTGYVLRYYAEEALHESDEFDEVDEPNLDNLIRCVLQVDDTTEATTALEDLLGVMDLNFDGDMKKIEKIQNHLATRTNGAAPVNELQNQIMATMASHLRLFGPNEGGYEHLFLDWSMSIFEPIYTFLRKEILHYNYNGSQMRKYVKELPLAVGRFQVDVLLETSEQHL